MMMLMLNSDLGMPINIQNIMRIKGYKKLTILYELPYVQLPLDAHLFPILMHYDATIPTAAKSGPTQVMMGQPATEAWYSNLSQFK
jgi:hypothetical protein